jgi:hypothetical protein
MDKPICGLLPIVRPGCVFCARKPISYGRCSGGKFASRDRRSCCLHLGAAFHREEVTNVPLRVVHRDCIVLFHPNFHGADPFEKDVGNRQFAIKPSRNLYADSGNSICRPGPGCGTCLRRNGFQVGTTSRVGCSLCFQWWPVAAEFANGYRVRIDCSDQSASPVMVTAPVPYPPKGISVSY